MKKVLTIILLAIMFSNCSNDDVFFGDDIFGEWKLLEARFYGPLGGPYNSYSSINYLYRNITYDFDTNGTLTVSGGDNVGYSIGAYSYTTEEFYVGPENDSTLNKTVKINGLKWAYQSKNGRLILSRTYVDGGYLIFTKK